MPIPPMPEPWPPDSPPRRLVAGLGLGDLLIRRAALGHGGPAMVAEGHVEVGDPGRLREVALGQGLERPVDRFAHLQWCYGLG